MYAATRLVRDPLIHFLIAGAALFALLSAVNPPGAADADKTIAVTREKLVGFIQYRSKAFEPNAAERILAGLQPEERQRLIADYVREEALYREAKALGLDANDYVIRQRLVEGAAFLSDATDDAAPPTESEIAAYFNTHRADYRVEPSITFAHVFFEGKDADSRAASLAAELNARKAPFEDAPRYGDRFPFHTNYVERTYDYVASQFGDATTQRLFDEKTPLNRWIGALRSDYGAHAVFISGRTPARDPDLAEIRDKVAEDANRDKRARTRAKAIDDLVHQYVVTVAPDANAPPPEVPAPPAAPRAAAGQTQ